jgi:hypothetical protein
MVESVWVVLSNQLRLLVQKSGRRDGEDARTTRALN